MPYFTYFRVLHLHVPKTGGTSLENTFRELLHSEFFDYVESKERWEKGDQRWQNLNLYGYAKKDGDEFALQHMTFSQMKEWGYLRGKEIDRIVIVVRHPYSRLVSEYKWQLIFGYSGTFNQFVREAWEKKWHQQRIFHQHLVPQFEFLRGIDLNDARLHVVYFEHMKSATQHFFNDMAADFDECNDAELRRDNETKEILNDSKIANKPWREFYENDPELFEIIEKMYPDDFETFGYEKNIDDVE